MKNLDRVDIKILYEISENARHSHNKIAKKIRISREVLEYRLKRLEQNGIIRNYQARINISRFIYGGYILLIQTTLLKKEIEEKILTSVKKNNSTQYIGSLGGDFDLIIGFTVKNIEGLRSYIEFINNIFGRKKGKMILLTMISEFKDSFRSIFSDREEYNSIISMLTDINNINLDLIDKEIIRSFGADCTIPSWKIAEKVGISDVAIRKRISKLEKSNIILGYRTMINLPALGHQIHNVFLKINPKYTESEKNLQSYFKSSNKVTYATKIIGEYDYIFTLLTENNLELKKFLNKLRDKFFATIVEINSMPLFEIIYHKQLAEDLLQ